ncbi:unnamed protein product, partial [Meganyctiphanes norvegica]
MNEYERRSSVGNMSGVQGHDASFDIEKSLSGSLAFTCPVCIKSYGKEKMLQVHMQEHIEDSLNRCQHCSKTFSSASKLKAHQKEHVATLKKLKCVECGLMFLDISSLNYHKQTHEKNGELLPCKDCQLNNGVCFAHYKTKVHADLQQSGQNGTAVSGQNNGKEKGAKVFLCKKCNKSFNDRLSLKKHKKDDHSSQRENVCKICNRAFQSNKQLTMHATFHNTDGAWECFYCHKKFNRAWKMKLHMGVSHTGKRPYICRFCGDDFLYPGNIMSHMKTVHNIWIVCKECGEPCESDEKLNTHVCKVYQCKDCCSSFETMEKLSEHVKTCDIKQMPSPTASSVPEVSQSTVIEHCITPNNALTDPDLDKSFLGQLPQSSLLSAVNDISASKYQGMLPSPVKQNLLAFSQAQYSPTKSPEISVIPSHQPVPIKPNTNKTPKKHTQTFSNFPNIQPKPAVPLSPTGSPVPIFDKVPSAPHIPMLHRVASQGSPPLTLPLQSPLLPHLAGAQNLPVPGLIPLDSPVNITDSPCTNFQNGLQTSIQNSLQGTILNDLQRNLQNRLPGNFLSGLPAHVQSNLLANFKNLEDFQKLQSTIQALYANSASMQANQTLPPLSPLLQPSAATAMAMLQQSSAVAALQALQQTTTTTVQSLQVPPPTITNSNGCTINYTSSNSPMDLSKMSQVAKCDTTLTPTKDRISLSRSTSLSSITDNAEPALPMDLCMSNSRKEYGGDGPTSMVSEPDLVIQNGLKALAATNVFARPAQPSFNNPHSDFCCSKDKNYTKK